MNPKRISRLLGIVIGVLAASMLSGVLIALIYGESQALKAFLASSALTGLIGAAFYFYGKPPAKLREREINPREAIVIVVFSWLFVALLGGLPYMFDGTFDHFEDAFFEAAAGFTTTGSTVLTEIEHSLSMAGHFWRTFTHWLGGMGIVVLFVAIFPELGVGGKHLFKSEVPGPITEDLKPKIKETSAALWKIYIGLTALDALLLWGVGGMDLFNAMTHAFSTLATGGFSTLNASIGGFHSLSIDIITTFFMFLAGVNFSLYYVALYQKNLKQALRDPEFLTYTLIVVGAILAVSIALYANGHAMNARPDKPADFTHFGSALRYGAFQVVSIGTTTGFGTDNFDQWPPFTKMILVFLMFMGASAGSTAGGIKVFRILVLFKAIGIEIHHAYRPQMVKALRVGHMVIPKETIRSIVVFFGLFMMTFVVGTLFVAAFGHDIITSASATVACLASIGPGLGKVNAAANYAFFEPPIKVLLALLMILGRLELMTFLVLFKPSFWKQ